MEPAIAQPPWNRSEVVEIIHLRASAEPIDSITDLLRGDSPAVFVRMGEKHYEILTKYDVVHTIAGLSEMSTGA